MSITQDFTVNGHSYKITLHPPDEGLEIVSEILGLGITPLLEAGVQAVLSGGKEVVLDANRLDLPAIGADLRKALQGGALGRLASTLLRHSWRDGKPLREPANFTAAYAANYGEMRDACLEVVTRNRFFSALGLSADT